MNFVKQESGQFDGVLIFEVFCLIFCFGLMALFPLAFVFQFTFSGKTLFFGLVGAILGYLLLILLSQSENLAKDIRKFHSGVIGRSFGFKYLWYPLLVSVPEELLFRFVIPVVILILFPISPWNVAIASLFFGLAHFRKNISLLVPLTAFAIGVVFALVYELSGKNLLAPISAHFIFTILRVYKFAKGDEE